VLFGLEWIKSTTLQTFFEIRFAENHTPKGMLVIVVLLVGASILTSVKGGDVLGAVRTEAPELADESAIVSRFDAQIAAERQHQQSIRDGRTHKWKGALTPQGAKELAASGKRLEKLLEQQEAEMLNARIGNAGAQMATASKSFANSKWFMGLALVVDLGILIAIFYRERFEYLTVALVTTGSAQPRPVSGISVGPGGVTLYGNPAQAPPDMPNRNAIGFQRQQAPVNPGLTTQVEHGQQSGGSFEDVVKAAEAAHLDSTYLSRYRPAVEVFLAGGSKMEAARAANCSRSTAHTVKQIMRQLKLIPEPQAQD
jgi:HPt (histidine-containing phosphotransfer) domain-containing protein